MKIQGVLTVEGVDLHVDIEAPDEQKELYVTNIHPNCLVIPKERWKIEFLGFPPQIVTKLKERKLMTLGDIVDGTWKVTVSGFDSETARTMQDALDRFRQIALVFEREDPLQASFEPARATSQRAEVSSEDTEAVLGTNILAIGLLKPVAEALRRYKGATTYGDLMRLGRKRLLMTERMDEKALAQITTTLQKAGLQLPE